MRLGEKREGEDTRKRGRTKRKIRGAGKEDLGLESSSVQWKKIGVTAQYVLRQG